MQKFQRSCLFHAEFPMRVLEENQEEEYKRLLQTGEWFTHPNHIKRGTKNGNKRERKGKNNAS